MFRKIHEAVDQLNILDLVGRAVRGAAPALRGAAPAALRAPLSLV